jgi:hypothetical protein
MRYRRAGVPEAGREPAGAALLDLTAAHALEGKEIPIKDKLVPRSFSEHAHAANTRTVMERNWASTPTRT